MAENNKSKSVAPKELDTSQDASKMESVASRVTPVTHAMVRLFNDILEILLGWFTLSVEVIIRREFGERYLSHIKIFFTVITMWIFAAVPTMFNGGLEAFGIFSMISALAATYHLTRIFVRNRKGMQWYSQCFGVSWLVLLLPKEKTDTGYFALTQWNIYRIIEPLLVFCIGLFITQLNMMLGVWFVMVGVALLFKNNLIYLKHRWRLLDIVDSRIESKYYSAAAKGKKPTETAGFTVMAASQDAIFASEILDISSIVAETVNLTDNSPNAIESRDKSTFDISNTIDDVVGAVEG